MERWRQKWKLNTQLGHNRLKRAGNPLERGQCGQEHPALELSQSFFYAAGPGASLSPTSLVPCQEPPRSLSGYSWASECWRSKASVIWFRIHHKVIRSFFYPHPPTVVFFLQSLKVFSIPPASTASVT